MKISEYIDALQAIELEHGDLEVVRITSNFTVSRRIGAPQLSYAEGDFFREDSQEGEKVCRI